MMAPQGSPDPRGNLPPHRRTFYSKMAPFYLVLAEERAVLSRHSCVIRLRLDEVFPTSTAAAHGVAGVVTVHDGTGRSSGGAAHNLEVFKVWLGHPGCEGAKRN
jgi:hypothetical protein